VLGFVAKVCLRILQRVGMRNVYVRRALWILACVRWIWKRRRGSTQVVRLRKGENLVISTDSREARL
jgi:hypothetical protein